MVLFDVNRTYSAQEVREVIKKLPGDQGDSLTIEEAA
jgi:hypothetical protein